MKRWTIYAICDPRDGSVFYIGQTTLIRRRLATHLGSRKERSWLHIQRLVNQDVIPTFRILAASHDPDEATRLEYQHIADHLARGAKLVNSSEEIGRALAQAAASDTSDPTA